MSFPGLPVVSELVIKPRSVVNGVNSPETRLMLLSLLTTLLMFVWFATAALMFYSLELTAFIFVKFEATVCTLSLIHI